MKKNPNYSISFDLGINTIGVSLVKINNDKHIIELMESFSGKLYGKRSAKIK